MLLSGAYIKTLHVPAVIYQYLFVENVSIDTSMGLSTKTEHVSMGMNTSLDGELKKPNNQEVAELC